MLTILGAPERSGNRFCDGLSRRGFLKIGGLAMGGLSLPQLLKAESLTGRPPQRHKGIIMIFLPGGPPHQDMFDLKTSAPVEIRGEFEPIATSVPGIQICEHMPRLAGMMEKFVPIRSVVGSDGRHDAYMCQTGWGRNQPSPQGGYPSLGSAVAKLFGSTDPAVPPFVGLAPNMGHAPWADPGSPGFLGSAYAPFKPNAEGKDDMVLSGITLDRLADRRRVLNALDNFRREADASGQIEGLDAFNQQAFGVLTSSRLADALDLSKEDPKVVERYGEGDPRNKADGGPRLMSHFLMARRLIQAGVRCVTLAFSRWDWHSNNFGQGRDDMPMLDQGVTALVEDLERHEMLDDTTVVVWGEFGRTPKINASGGRDHWPQVSCALLAGGGLPTGQVIGSTNRLGEHAQDRPVHFQEIFATLYKTLGIDIDHTTLIDRAGRPQFLVDHNRYAPMPELL